MDRTKPRYKTVESLGRSLALLYGLSDGETVQLLQFVREYEDRNSAAPGANTAHGSQVLDAYMKLGSTGDGRLAHAVMQFVTIDMEYWKFVNEPPPSEQVMTLRDLMGKRGKKGA